MRFTTLSNYYLIDWWCNFDFCLFACWIYFRFCYSYMTWETGGLELASTIILVLQANRLTKCASHPGVLVTKCASLRKILMPFGIFESFHLHLGRSKGLQRRFSFIALSEERFFVTMHFRSYWYSFLKVLVLLSFNLGNFCVKRSRDFELPFSLGYIPLLNLSFSVEVMCPFFLVLLEFDQS